MVYFTHGIACAAAEHYSNENRPNGSADDDGTETHVIGALIAVEARENEQGNQAAKCISLEPIHVGIPSA
jgi:hypothetical protein